MDQTLIAKMAARRQMPPPWQCEAIRKRAGLSRADIARSLGVTSQAVRYWEQGARRPRGGCLLAYSQLMRELRDLVETFID